MEGSFDVKSLDDSLIYLILSQATSQDPSVLKPAERKLLEWETGPGFYVSISRFISNKDVELPVRWLATVYLKNAINRYWRKTAPNCISSTDKQAIRAELVKCFEEPVDAIAFQIAEIMAKIARIDWPVEWPDFVFILLGNMQCNDDDMKRYRALLILSHVIKTFSTKRLIGDKRSFCELTSKIYPIMLQFWNCCFDTFLFNSLEQKKTVKYKYDLEMTLYATKILSKLTVFGFTRASFSDDAMNFCLIIFDKIKTILQCRKSLLNELDEKCIELLEKQALTLVKVLSSVLEIEPFSYVNFIGVTLEHCFYYGFTKEGNDLVFDSLLIRWLNLMKAILLCQEYKLNNKTIFAGTMDKDLLGKIEARNAFFTPVIAHEICYKLINEYFMLTEKDLALWDSDPEQFAAEEIGESWRYNLKSCAETLLMAFLSQYGNIVTPILVNTIESHKESPNPNDITAILKKDAVYNVFGLAGFQLFDEINFDKWFSEILIPELHVKEPNYRILRRRILWLIGKWTGIKLSTELRPQLYSEIIRMMDPAEDMVVRLTVANTLKQTIDDFEFRSDVFLQHIPHCFGLLYALLEQSNECETKMQVLTVLNFIIERVGWDIAPFFSSLVNYLPLLWQHAGDHNMLRCAIVSVLTQIVRGLGDQCFTLEKFIIPVIEYSLDTKQEGHVYLQEDGLYLFSAYLENVNASDDIFPVFRYLPPLIERSTENLNTIVNIMTALLLLNSDKFLKNYGECSVKTLLDLLPDLKSEGVLIILTFFETCIKIQPYIAIELLKNFLQDLFVNISADSDKYLQYILFLRISILVRIILLSYSVFAQLVESTSIKHNTSPELLFTNFLDTGLSTISIVWPTQLSKLLGLAFLQLLTDESNIVLTRFSAIMAATVTILHDIADYDDNNVYTDSLLVNDDGVNASTSEEREGKTEHEVRLSTLTFNDPVHKVDFLWYFRSQMEKLQRQIGNANFRHLMGTVTENTISSIKTYIKQVNF